MRISSQQRNEQYRLRLLAALATSVGLLLVATRLPIQSGPVALGWGTSAFNDPIHLQELREVLPPEDEALLVVEEPSTEEAEGAEDGDIDVAEEETVVDETVTDRPIVADIRPMAQRQVLEFADVSPRVQGGLNAYYMNITYPQAAQRAGIQGRVVLDFVVMPDGRPSRIRVLQSLHALCDTAAVRALRETHFLPGRQNGETVAVRMRLPVRFRLMDQAPTDSVQTSDA